MEILALLILVAIGIMIFKSSSETSTQEPVPSARAQPITPSLDVNDPYEVCRALACLATSIPYYKSDTACMIHIHIDNEKKETYISLNISDYSIDRTDISQYHRLRISDQIATLLSTVNFNDNGEGSWNITFSQSISERRAKEAIQAGIGMVNGRPYICNLKSYFIGNNPSQIAIDFDGAD